MRCSHLSTLPIDFHHNSTNIASWHVNYNDRSHLETEHAVCINAIIAGGIPTKKQSIDCGGASLKLNFVIN